jgi:hypothetical protein
LRVPAADRHAAGVARGLLRLSAKLIVGAGLLYAVFFVKLGAFTLYEHAARIVATPEAQELGAGVSGAVGGVADVLGSGVGAADALRRR